jgi:phosphoglycolate phosphatase
MRRFEFVIWDWNGTLVNDAMHSWDVINQLLIRRGMPTVEFENYQKIYQHPIIKIYEALGFDFAKESLQNIADEWHADYSARLPKIELHVDSIKALDTLKSLGVNQSILSALPHEILCESVNRHGVGSYFSSVVGLKDKLGESKVQNGAHLMKEIGAKPEKTILIGDSSHDLETAEAIGATCYLVSRGYEDKARLLRHGIDVFDDFEELLSHIGL